MSTKLFLPLKGRSPTPLGSAGRGETVAGRWAEPPASLLGTGRKAGWVNIRANSHTHTHTYSLTFCREKLSFQRWQHPCSSLGGKRVLWLFSSAYVGVVGGRDREETARMMLVLWVMVGWAQGQLWGCQQ